jgi:outer membrane immunogenic protein
MKTAVIGSAVVAILLGAPAMAADMAVKSPPMMPSYSWTGFYVGGNAGYGWKDDPVVAFGPDPLVRGFICNGGGAGCIPAASFNIGGALIGLQAGYNWQFNPNWLLSLEADYDRSSLKGSGISNFIFGGPSNFVATENVRWFGTVRGRLGYLPSNSILVFATAGLAVGRVDENISLNTVAGNSFVLPNGNGWNCIAGQNCFLGNSSRTQSGWTTGAGFEYLIQSHVSLSIEYLYVNLGSGGATKVVAQTSFPLPASFTASYGSVDFQVVRAGVNWRF